MENAETSLGRPLIPKKKRGRPPKIRYSIPNEIELPSASLPDGAFSELQLGYKPLKEMIGMSQLRPLIEKPDELLYGLHDYYDVIEEPMWLLEMSRKYTENKYETIVDVMKDMRLVLENSYKFWGKKHKFGKQTLRAERILDKHLMDFPAEVRSKCCMTLYDSEDAVSAEGIDSFESDVPSEYTSKILRNLSLKPITIRKEPTVEEMNLWGKDVLQESQLERQIHVMPELAEIGQFLLMTREILCLKPISQYEIERMLVMPRESTTLATIMTSFLCSPALRPTLYFKPIMVYDIWVSLLHKRLDIWYNVYHKFNNRMAVFLKYGVEPTFFECLGEVNPLTDTAFHELELQKKAVIVKALCSSMFHSNKKIEEYFNELSEDALKPKLLFSDSKHEYVSLFSPEIRVYRFSKICLDIDATIEAVFPHYFQFYPKDENEENLPEVPFSKKQKFSLVAHDRESLASLAKMFSKKKGGRAAINKLLSEEKNREIQLIGLRALYSQWKKSMYKDQNSVTISQQYWISRASNDTSEENATGAASEVKTEGSPLESLGKRIMKRKYPLEEEQAAFSSNDERPNVDDVSDWEDGNKRRSRRAKKASGLPRFFDQKFMKFENGGQEPVAGSKSRKLDVDGNPLSKKPRKKREKKVVEGEPKEKVVKRRNSKKLSSLETCGIRLQSNPLGIMQDEPYLPPVDLPKFVQSAQPLINAAQPSSSSEQKSDLFDWGSWDFGQPILKPVENPLPAPEEGEKKILELGAVKPVAASSAPNPALHKVPGFHNVPPKLGKPPRIVAPPRKHQSKPLYPGVPMMNMSNVHTNFGTPGRGRILQIPTPGPSGLPNRVVLPWEDLSKSRFLSLDPRFLPADAIVVKTGPPPAPLRLPVHRQAQPPSQPVFFKRRVNLPARPLNIPVVPGQEVSFVQRQQLLSPLSNLESNSTVLFIPSGTPTITIPSSSGSSEEKTLTVL